MLSVDNIFAQHTLFLSAQHLTSDDSKQSFNNKDDNRDNDKKLNDDSTGKQYLKDGSKSYSPRTNSILMEYGFQVDNTV